MLDIRNGPQHVKELAKRVDNLLIKQGRTRDLVMTYTSDERGVSVDPFFKDEQSEAALEAEIKTVIEIINADPELHAEFDEEIDGSIYVTLKQ